MFFKRFMHEVVGRGDGTMAGGLAATADELTWGHRQVFSRLDRMADELRADRSKPQLAAAVTLYHVIVEASLAQPGQHMIETYLEEFDVLPGFRAGMRNVALDEQRHIGFGVKLLADLYAEDPEPIGEAIVGLIREVLPWTTAVAKPPNWDRSYTECFGFTLEDLGEAGAASIEQKLRAIGLPVDTLPRFPMPMDLPPRERALRGQKMLHAGLIGPGDEGVHADDETLAIWFDQIARQADATAVRPGTTIAWDFTDAPPWTLTLDGVRATAAQAPARGADLTLRSDGRRLRRRHRGPRRRPPADAPAPPAAAGQPPAAARAAAGPRLARHAGGRLGSAPSRARAARSAARGLIVPSSRLISTSEIDIPTTKNSGAHART